MTRFEEKLYLQNVFDAIDQVYKMKKPQQISSYEERLRASFNKLIVPDWYNHEYTSINGLRKTKSHGHVPRVKRTNNNNNNDDTPDTSVSSSINSPYLSNGTHRHLYHHRSPSHSWSERPPLRRDSTTSSYDTNGSVIINGRRSTTSNGSSSYAPGVQRVAQSSTWYKPRLFTTKTTNGNTNGHSIAPPKPLPRYSKIDQERIQSLDSSSSLPSKIENIRCPIKPRTMAQAQIPSEESFLNVSSDSDVTIVQNSSILQTIETSVPDDSTNIPRTNSLRSVSSDAESYRSAALPSIDKNLLATDSSSYDSVNERCLSPSTASYHTAMADDTLSSMTGYETPTPQLDDDNATLSSHSSLSDLSHAETLEPNVEDLDTVGEQKFVIIPSVDIGMENSSSPLSNIDSSTTNDTRSIENTNWYDGSLETCIHQTAPNQIESSEIREISNDDVLREVDINAVGDEFFLFSPRNSNDDELLNEEIIESPTQLSKRIFTMENNNLNDPYDFDDNNNISSIMITNLDDILIDDDDDDYSPNHFLNKNYRRPIQEDILYEVEHENSFSDHSQNTSSIIATDDKTSSIKLDANIDYLTSTDSPIINNIQQNEKQPSIINDNNNNNNILPIYILPPLYTTSPLVEPSSSSSSLHIDTNNNFQKWDTFIHQFSDLTSPSAYTSKIRHRQFSVGSYYDHKTTTVTLHPNNPFYFLGSAPVSPLSRTPTTNNESHYHIHHHHSPLSYDNGSLNALRRVNPFLESNTYSNIDYKRPTDYRSSSLNRDEKTRVITYTSPKMTSKSVEKTIPITQTEPTPILPRPLISPPSIRTSSVAFPQYEMPVIRPKPTTEIPELPPRFSKLELEPPLIRPKTSRGRFRSPPLPTRTKSIEKDQTQNIYQEIDSTSTDDDNLQTPNSDLQFIRGAIERVFHFNGESTTDTTSESSTHYEELEDNNQNQSKKNSNQYPAVEAVQRFYNYKTLSDFEKPITNLDDNVTSNSSTSKKSPPITAREKDRSKSSEHKRTSSEVDDTLNDIEDVDSHDERFKRQLIHNHSTHTSSENSPLYSSDTQSKTKKTSQETQTIGQRSTVPPIDIVTEMVIEQDDDDDNNNNNNNGQIDNVDGDMVIFYDDIEIVEHLTSSCSSESDSASSVSHHYSKPINIKIHEQLPPPPPPVPARTLKPIHLLNNNNHRQSPSTTNKTYELEKQLIRKKFDVNSVNDMLNRTEQNLGPSGSDRHPSARHFVGKLNNDDTPLQSIQTNGYKRTVPKNSSATLPIRSSIINPSNEKHRSVIADTNALVKQIQNSLHIKEINSKNLSNSTKDLRAFVSTTYSPSNENLIDDNGNVHIRQQINNHDDQTFKRQARLSKSFHNVSEYNSTDQYPKQDNKTQPSKSVENNLNEVIQTKQSHIPLNLTSVVTSTSFSALPNADDHAKMLSMRWYTGQVSENSEICYNAHHVHTDDLLYGYISTHSNRETQALLARLKASNDPRIHAALDDIRSRVAQFDASKTREDIHVFMRYLESRLRDLNNKKSNGHQQPDNTSIKSRTTSTPTDANNKDIPTTRQLGRQHLRSSGSIGEGTSGHQPTPPRRASQSSSNQENPAVFDEMLNTVLGLPKKGVSALPQTFPFKREKPAALIPTQITTNTTAGRDIGKRLFESGTYEDPRLIYDRPKRKEKEEQPLETSV